VPLVEQEMLTWWGVLDTTLCDKVCQWLATGRWFSPVSSINKTDRHDITKIVLKEALNTINWTYAKPSMSRKAIWGQISVNVWMFPDDFILNIYIYIQYNNIMYKRVILRVINKSICPLGVIHLSSSFHV
jgi:hypothetical protein